MGEGVCVVVCTDVKVESTYYNGTTVHTCVVCAGDSNRFFCS